jgi:glycosyltransferase involved in cell wall biosynthesis
MLFPGTSQFVPDTEPKKNINALPILDSINPITWYKSANVILKSQPGLVLTSYWMPFFAPSLGVVSRQIRKKRVKVVSVLHNVIPHEKRTGDTALSKFFFRQNNGLFVLNEESQKDLLSLMPEAKTIVHPHPFYNHYGDKMDKDEARKKLKIPEGKKVILFFGFIRDYKGLDLLLEAIKDEDYYLVIAGECYGSFDKYDEIIRKSNLQDRISLNIKYIPDEEVSVYFSSADVTILPYRSGTQSGIIGISYHFNIPVVVADTGGLKEMVEENKTGLIMKSASPENIKSALSEFYSKYNSIDFTGNIEEIKKKYSWKSFADEVIKFSGRIE